MRVVLQRVRNAEVLVDGEVVGKIGKGAVLFLGVTQTDSEEDVRTLADKCLSLRIFEDEEGKMNLSCQQVGGEFLIVSQFTLYGDVRKGRRPSFDDAALPAIAESLYESFVNHTRQAGIEVATGSFRRKMLVRIENDGPVTFFIDSKQL
jgi:D-tyrosyl-tRNA(Tyr) deacylase